MKKLHEFFIVFKCVLFTCSTLQWFLWSINTHIFNFLQNKFKKNSHFWSDPHIKFHFLEPFKIPSFTRSCHIQSELLIKLSFSFFFPLILEPLYLQYRERINCINLRNRINEVLDTTKINRSVNILIFKACIQIIIIEHHTICGYKFISKNESLILFERNLKNWNNTFRFKVLLVLIRTRTSLLTLPPIGSLRGTL